MIHYTNEETALDLLVNRLALWIALNVDGLHIRLPNLSCLKSVQRIIKGDQGENFLKKFMRPPNTTKFLFENDDQI
jgi:hypothetical protein